MSLSKELDKLYELVNRYRGAALAESHTAMMSDRDQVLTLIQGMRHAGSMRERLYLMEDLVQRIISGQTWEGVSDRPK